MSYNLYKCPNWPDLTVLAEDVHPVAKIVEVLKPVSRVAYRKAPSQEKEEFPREARVPYPNPRKYRRPKPRFQYASAVLHFIASDEEARIEVAPPAPPHVC